MSTGLTLSEAHAAFASQIGYTLRGIAPSCLLLVGGLPPLYIDADARPLSVAPPEGRLAALDIEMTQADMLAIAPGKELEIDGWMASGRIAVRGSTQACARLRARVRGGISANRYEEITERIRDPRFVFVNHGYAETDGTDDFGWVDVRDRPWRYNLNLVRQVVRGVDLDHARVLDVSCGRGGGCACFVRYHRPLEVVGVDLIEGQIDFCRATHQAPNLRFLQADAQHLPFEDARFDVVTNVESSHGYPDLDAFLSEVRRVLRPGGTFCWADMLPAGETASRARRLGEFGAVGVARRITPEVIEALTRAREPLLALAHDIARDAGVDGAFVERFARDVLQCRNNYVAGAWDYAIWQMVR